MPTPTLLLADDSLTIRRVIELTFADQNIRVETASGGREAIQKITTTPPDIILADVGMPEHDGYEVAAFVKKSAHLSHIPVLLLAGAFEPVDHARARHVGCDGVLVKPFEPQLVIARVRELLAGRKAVAPAPGASDRQPAANGSPESPEAASPAGGDYLDRLDAAFTAMNTSHRPFGTPLPSVLAGAAEDGGGGSGWNPQIVTNSGEPVHQAGATTPASAQNAGSVYQTSATSGGALSPSLSDAFGALLAAERGNPSASGSPLPPITLSDATLDEIARRVIARLGDEPMRQAVLDAAERLVREEIERIKKVQERT